MPTPYYGSAFTPKSGIKDVSPLVRLEVEDELAHSIYCSRSSAREGGERKREREEVRSTTSTLMCSNLNRTVFQGTHVA